MSFSKKEKSMMKRMNNPAKVQDYLNSLKFNFEEDGKQTLKSPLYTIRAGKAHCIEGAILGAYVLSLHGYKPLIMHLAATKNDFDHVVVPFKEKGFWGALSKTNHAVLRYREPVYKNIRELAMSYFHEYFLHNGKKTMRKYSRPLNLNVFEKKWFLQSGDLWGIDEELDKIRHYEVAPASFFKRLRKADNIELAAGKIVEFSPKKKNKKK